MSMFDPEEKVLLITFLKYLAYLMWYSNAWINFVVYALNLKEFKVAFIKLLKQLKPGGHHRF